MRVHNSTSFQNIQTEAANHMQLRVAACPDFTVDSGTGRNPLRVRNGFFQ
jgi:hypothetical protein